MPPIYRSAFFLLVFCYLDQDVDALIYKQREGCAPENLLPASCDQVPGYTDVAGSCYKFIRANATWADSRKLCGKDAKGGDLGVIRCASQNEALTKMMHEKGLYKESINYPPDLASGYWRQQVWIGVEKLRDGTLRNVQGVNSSYVNWGSTEPSEMSAGENCLFILSKNGAWVDHLCDHTPRNALCEVRTKTTASACSGLLKAI
ncbi:unnamed protein product, partial [Mesorhabditis spiculigera]